GADSRRFDSPAAVMTLPVAWASQERASTNARRHHCKRGESVCLRKIDGDGCRCFLSGVAYPTNGRHTAAPHPNENAVSRTNATVALRKNRGLPNISKFSQIFPGVRH